MDRDDERDPLVWRYHHELPDRTMTYHVTNQDDHYRVRYDGLETRAESFTRAIRRMDRVVLELEARGERER